MTNKRNYIIIGVVILGMIILLPLAIDKIILGNQIPSNLNNSEWASFFGSYIGGAFSFAGVLATVIFATKQSEKDRKFMEKQNQEARKAQVAPCFNVEFNEIGKLKYENQIKRNKFFREVTYSEYKQELTHYESQDYNLFGVLSLKNVGIGPVINFYISDIKFKEINLSTPKEMLDANGLQPGETWNIGICLGLILGEVPQDLLTKNEEIDSWIPTNEATKAKCGDLEMKINYSDVLNTPYEQFIKLHIKAMPKEQDKKLFVYCPSMKLESVSPRKESEKPITNLALRTKEKDSV